MSCLPRAEFLCNSAPECTRSAGGECHPNGYCSYPDSDCPGQRRWSPLAQPDLAGACLDIEPSTSSTATTLPLPSTSSSTTTMVPEATSSSSSGDAVPDGWWDCGWSTRRDLAFADDIEGTHNDMTVLVLVSPEVASDAAADGDDLRFVDEDDATELPYEIERWDPATGSVAWVRVPNVTQGRLIRMYTGNAAADAGSDPEAAWGPEHAAVWHLGESSDDSTANRSHLSNNGPGIAAGRIGDGRAFVADEDVLDGATPKALANLFHDGATAMAWVRVTAFTDPHARIVQRSQTTVGHAGWYFGVAATISEGPTESLVFYQADPASGGRWGSQSGSVQADGTWHLVGVAYDLSVGGSPTFYVDGEERTAFEGFPGTSGSGSEDSPYPLTVGNNAGFGTPFRGDLDEVRLDSVFRSAQRMNTEYRSMTGDLIAIGPAVSSPCKR